ncbi:hypothetical protein ABT332_11530 [Saccharomonospora azurea]|uniref:hypothetical protein n=1 Tax=Saccharomonospora azurea TaxID=40988 RepID=UPI00331EEEB4
MTTTNSHDTRDMNDMNDMDKVMHTAREGVRTSLLAALGAGSMASQAVADALSKAKERVSSSSEAARKNIEDLPSEFEHLRGRLEPSELRKLIDDSAEAATNLYRKLVSSGEQTWERAVEPQVKRGVEQFEETLRTAQERVDHMTTDARERFDEAMALISRRARETEEKVDTAATGKAEDKPGPVKAEAERMPTRATAGTKATKSATQPASPTASQRSAKAASARKKAMKPDTNSSATRTTRSRRTSPGSGTDTSTGEA